MINKLKQLNESELQSVFKQLSAKHVELLDNELAKDSFYHFTKCISKIYDETVDMTFLTYVMVCEVVQAFIENRLFTKINDEYKQVDILFLNACPGWGKSYLVTRLLNLWWLAKNHKLQYIITANEKNRKKIMDDIRVLMNLDKFKSIFDDFKLIKNNDGEKVTDKQGYLYMNPSRSDITGTRGDLFIFDDFFKPTNITRAEHQTSKDFLDRYMTRGFKKDKRITKRMIVEQRIDFQDATGYLIQNYQNGNLPYCQIKIPYLFESNINYEFYIKENNEIKLKTYDFTEGSFSSKEFSLQAYDKLLFTDYGGDVNRRQTECQQEPTTSKDAIVKKEWFVYEDPNVMYSRHYELVIMSCDTAMSTKTTADYTAITIWGQYKGKHYLLGVKRYKLETHDIYHKIAMIYNNYNDGIHTQNFQSNVLLIEKASSGSSIYSFLQDGLMYRTHGVQPNAIEIGVNKSKADRLLGCNHIIHGGNVIFPGLNTNGNITQCPQWLKDFEYELLYFENGAKHDDQVDSMTLYLNYCIANNQRHYNIYYEPW